MSEKQVICSSVCIVNNINPSHTVRLIYPICQQIFLINPVAFSRNGDLEFYLADFNMAAFVKIQTAEENSDKSQHKEQSGPENGVQCKSCTAGARVPRGRAKLVGHDLRRTRLVVAGGFASSFEMCSTIYQGP